MHAGVLMALGARPSSIQQWGQAVLAAQQPDHNGNPRGDSSGTAIIPVLQQPLLRSSQQFVVAKTNKDASAGSVNVPIRGIVPINALRDDDQSCTCSTPFFRDEPNMSIKLRVIFGAAIASTSLLAEGASEGQFKNMLAGIGTLAGSIFVVPYKCLYFKSLASLGAGSLMILPHLFWSQGSHKEKSIVASLIYCTALSILWCSSERSVVSKKQNYFLRFVGAMTAVWSHTAARLHLSEPWASLFGSFGIATGNLIAFPPEVESQKEAISALVLTPFVSLACYGLTKLSDDFSFLVSAIAHTALLSSIWYPGVKRMREVDGNLQRVC